MKHTLYKCVQAYVDMQESSKRTMAEIEKLSKHNAKIIKDYEESVKKVRMEFQDEDKFHVQVSGETFILYVEPGSQFVQITGPLDVVSEHTS